MTTELSRKLRRESTPPERRMWSLLKPFRISGWHFRREVPIGPYVADFACLHAGLVIEVDGRSHDHADVAAHDALRDAYMAGRGLHVLRFPNEAVLKYPGDVMAQIAEVLDAVRGASNTPTPVPSPQGGGEPRRRPRRHRPPRSGQGTPTGRDI